MYSTDVAAGAQAKLCLWQEGETIDVVQLHETRTGPTASSINRPGHTGTANSRDLGWQKIEKSDPIWELERETEPPSYYWNGKPNLPAKAVLVTHVQ